MLDQIGDLVDEAYLGGQHGVGHVLGEFGRAYVHELHSVGVGVKGCIEFVEDLPGGCGIRAYHDPVGLHEISDRRAFLEKLRIGCQGNIEVTAAFIEHGLNRGPYLV